MEYSQVSEIFVKNFMSIGEVKIDFKKSPIVALLAGSDVGKSALIRAVGVLACNNAPLKQKDYIRDGTLGFGVACILKDGSEITRIKTSNSNSYVVKVPGKETWETSKIDREEKVPEKVQEVMGFIQEPETNEFLHIRTYEDQLLFVFTPCSTNYKVMYNALRVENITKAIKDGTKEANELTNTINEYESAIKEQQEFIRSVRISDITPIINIKERLSKEIEVAKKLSKAVSLIKRNDELDKQLGITKELINNSSEVHEREVFILNKIDECLRALKNLDSTRYAEIGKTRELNTVIENRMLNVISKIHDTEIKKAEHKIIGCIEETKEIECRGIESKMIHLINSINAVNELKSKVYDLTGANEISKETVDTQNKMLKVMELMTGVAQRKEKVEEYTNKANELGEVIKKSGATVKECPKCGETVIMM